MEWIKQWVKRVWLKIRVYVIVILAFIGGISNTYAYIEFQDLWADYQEALSVSAKYVNKGVSFIYIKKSGELVSADSLVVPAMEAGHESDQPSVQEIADRIFILESSAGKNDSCRLRGMYNGYGYMQSKFYNECFESQEKVRGLVENWISDKLNKNYKTAELVCFYNRGIKTDSCEYANKFFSL